ncbi:MAG TPA: 16S rRNA (cytosine(967)-C(5))-methyltransferase RsmB [Candidatus Limnocylindrales bacterium]|nr:16S rRNA (cytosine(967)-C(5))-methyltransferase RsmB [Candidatus Limnocylindrales bacterium]
MPVSRARAIAFETLRRVEEQGAYASDVLHAELDERVKAEDAALATEIALGVLRWRALLDFLLERQLKKPVARLDLPVTLALRMGLYQLRFLERVPARAAVNESVELVKRARKTSAASLVNAVLRRLGEGSAREDVAKLLPPGRSRPEQLAILYSHPAWLVERWLARRGEAQTIELLKADNEAPPLSCAVHDAAHFEEIKGALEKSGLRVEPGRLLKSALTVSGGSPARTAAFAKGWISIQDEASQAIPLLLDVRAGDRVLDLCAAPGGKTAALARAAGETGLVVAADRHAHRLRAMSAQLERLQLKNVALVELDAEKPLPFGAKFDRILVDAPCSGTGTLARHPEIRWRLRPEQLGDLQRQQIAILRAAAAQLAPGGRLVYSTCSLEAEENENVVEAVLRDTTSLRRLPAEEAAVALAPHLAAGDEPRSLFDAHGQFRTVPDMHSTDGFFAAVLQL